MVTVVPQGKNLGSSIGQSLGQGLQAGLQQSVQRGQLQHALGGLKDIKEGSSPVEILTQLLSATAGIPGAERYIGQIYPLLLQQKGNQKFGEIPGPGQGNIPAPNGQSNQQIPGQNPQQNQNQPQSTSQSPQQNGQASQDQLRNQGQSLPIPVGNPTENPFGNVEEGIDLGLGPIPNTYSADQYRQVEQSYRSQGLDPAIAIDFMNRNDEVARGQQQDLLRAAQTQYEVQNLRNQAQENFRTKLNEALPNLSTADNAIAELIGNEPEQKKIKNLSLRANQTKKKFDLYKAAEKNFEKSVERPSFGLSENEIKRKEKEIGNNAQVLIQHGQRAKVENDIAKGGWGPIEKETILNPLPESFEKQFDALPKVPYLGDLVTTNAESPNFEKEVEQAASKRDEIMAKYGDFIKKNFKTGENDPLNVVKPGTSLLLLQDQALKKGFDYRQFATLINGLVQNGDIKLDEYQQKDLPLLSKHPISNYGIGEILMRMVPGYINRK